jgi:hypothetical protein
VPFGPPHAPDTTTTAITTANQTHPNTYQVYLPMSYLYGTRATCRETPITAAIRCGGHWGSAL